MVTDEGGDPMKRRKEYSGLAGSNRTSSCQSCDESRDHRLYIFSQRHLLAKDTDIAGILQGNTSYHLRQ